MAKKKTGSKTTDSSGTKTSKGKQPPRDPGASMEAKLKRRKLDALKQGIHRIGEEQTLPVAVHYIGIGKAGAGALAQIINDLPDSYLEQEGVRFTALAVDIGDQDLGGVREAAGRLPKDRVQVETVALEVPTRNDLFATLRRYREFLKLEYPRYYWNPNYEPWLPSKTTLPQAGETFPRATAKGIYGQNYYDGERGLKAALQRFSQSVEEAMAQSVVCIVFGMSGGTGSGMVVDLARHIANVNFGRRALVVGIGIGPCDGDSEAHKGAHMFPVLNELDCMGDQAKNEGVIAVWGDLYRNPFTGGFIMVPQQQVWESTQDLAATQARVNQEIASFTTRNNSTDLWETLRLLNWVGAPPTQHAAARTPFGAKWAHVLGIANGEDIPASGEALRQRLGILPTYQPDFIEVRAADPESPKTRELAEALGKTFSPGTDPEVTKAVGASEGSVQFLLPCVGKTDLGLFFESRDQYDTLDWEQKLSRHSWLLDLGVLLSEPAIRFDGMAGECLWGCACWVVVPYEQMRGPEKAITQAAE